MKSLQSARTAAALALALCTLGSPGRALAGLPEELSKIEKAYQSQATVQADFTQTEWNELTQAKRVTQGSIKVKLPNKLKWEQTEPEKSLLVSNGKIYWYYTPPFSNDDNGQVVIMRAQQVQSKLATQLLTGRFSQIKGLKTKHLEKPGTFELIPAPGTAASVARIELSLNEKESLVERIVLEHQGGNKTEIELKKIRLGEKINASEFVFKAPPKTDILKQ